MKQASRENHYHYNRKLMLLARKNRNNMPKSQVCMWKYLLRAGSFRGYKFRRERPILNYIADFVCFELMLIIEVDGESHHNIKSVHHDHQRDIDLRAIGFDVLRFNGFMVLNEIDKVEMILNEWLDKKIKSPPVVPQRGT
jgi:very-short-patch-repair endonuclease